MLSKLSNTNFNFVGKIKRFSVISLAIILIGLAVSFFGGVELDISFSGGTRLNYTFEGEINANEVEDIVGEVIDSPINVIRRTDFVTAAQTITVELATNEALEANYIDEINERLAIAFYDNNLQSAGIQAVSPRAGTQLFVMSLWVTGLALAVVTLYLGIRFRKIGGFSAGVAALITLIHDVAIAFFAFVIFGIPISESFFAVVFIILGYSLNSNIVIFDRIREIRVNTGDVMSLRDNTNLAINNTLRRVVITTISTVMVAAVMVIVAAIRGLDSIVGFALPMAIGLFVGGYSSVFLAAPMWVRWNEMRGKGGKKDKGKKKNSAI